jgi:uncharacterized protein YidB (DUF937 family)
MPSLAALLGLLAIAGYQNRDKLGELLKNATKPGSEPGPATGAAPWSDSIKSIAESGDPLKTIQGGLADVVDRFRNAGVGAAADSWLQRAERADHPGSCGKRAWSGSDRHADKTDWPFATGALSRLSKVLPEAVDKLTPDGRLPAG